jgi:uroporphyrinogen decarboxylase
MQDGIHHLIPEAQIKSAKKLRDTYNRKPGAPFFHKTFGLWMCLDHWYETGLDRSVDLTSFFLLDPPGHHELGQLGWCEAAFVPHFDEIILKDLGDKEIVQDIAGRSVLYFKGRRHGFMPEYLDHPVKDRKTWEENVKWRLDPKTPERYPLLTLRMDKARQAAANGLMIQQNLIGGYMYLRSLFGPEHLLYAFYDNPKLVHDCMKSWYELADQVIAKHQKAVTLDELFMAEDICYNHGPLISPEMIQSFLFPYYQQLVENIKKRQLDKNRHLYIQIDTDGDAISVIDLYRDHIGMDVMSPFEVASGCDVRHVADHYPDLVISGGLDKRILSKGKAEIDRYLESILPVMRKRGGYIPTEDHGVPPEVSWQNFHYYRQRCVELGE